MQSVYELCPQLENEDYVLRLLEKKDIDDLLKVYSDEEAIKYFNSDNCEGDDFHYTTRERMEKQVDYWLFEYSRSGFVRWTIVDKHTQEAIGTVELFRRESEDYFNDCGILRLDLRSDYEKEESIFKILSTIVRPTFIMFHCSKIAIKAIPSAKQRIAAIQRLGFRYSTMKVIGHGGEEYGDYHILDKE